MRAQKFIKKEKRGDVKSGKRLITTVYEYKDIDFPKEYWDILFNDLFNYDCEIAQDNGFFFDRDENYHFFECREVYHYYLEQEENLLYYEGKIDKYKDIEKILEKNRAWTIHYEVEK